MQESRRSGYRLIVIAIMLGLVGTLAGCGLLPRGLPSPDIPTVEEPDPTDEVDPTDEAGKADEEVEDDSDKETSDKGTPEDGVGDGREVTLTMVNDLSETVCYVLISPISEDTWGEDWLGAREVVEAGRERDFTVETGHWDIMAADCDENELAVQFGVDLTADMTWVLSETVVGGAPAGGSIPFTIHNESSSEVYWVYISPTASDVWGADWLGSDTIPVASSYTFFVEPGEWDLMAENSSGEQMDAVVGIMAGTGDEIVWTLTDDGFIYSGQSDVDVSEALLWVVNNTTTEVCWLYISLSSSDSWGEDWLGADMVSGGSETMFALEPGLYDLRAEDCAGDLIAERFGVDVSGEMEWELYENDAPGSDMDGWVNVTFINDTSEPVCYVWYGPPASEWIGDALGSQIIDGWGSLEVYLPPETLVLQAEDCSSVVMKRAEGFNPSPGAVWHINP